LPLLTLQCHVLLLQILAASSILGQGDHLPEV
jgi:hypothetical protein